MQLDLFGWWMVSISSSIVFLTLVSIYIYATRNGKACETKNKKGVKSIVVNFAFVWVLIGLLLFYIFSIQVGSSLVFAAGNILVEIMLVVYLVKNKPASETSDTPAS